MPWQKGQSGNPGGRSQKQADIERLAREYAPQAIKALVSALADPKSCVAAAKVLLDRGFGMPQQNVNANITVFDQIGDGAAERIEAALIAAISREEGGAERTATQTRLQ